MVGFDIDEIIKYGFDSFLQRYQEGLKKTTKGSDFVCEIMDGLHNNCHKVSLKNGGSYIKNHEWLKKTCYNKPIEQWS